MVVLILVKLVFKGEALLEIKKKRLTNVASRQQAGGMTLPLPPEQPAPGPTSTPVPNPSSPPDQTDDSCPTYRADCSPENLFSDTHVLPQAKALGMPGNQAQVGSGKRGRETPRN